MLYSITKEKVETPADTGVAGVESCVGMDEGRVCSWVNLVAVAVAVEESVLVMKQQPEALLCSYCRDKIPLPHPTDRTCGAAARWSGRWGWPRPGSLGTDGLLQVAGVCLLPSRRSWIQVLAGAV
jgi:hypothetical protein